MDAMTITPLKPVDIKKYTEAQSRADAFLEQQKKTNKIKSMSYACIQAIPNTKQFIMQKSQQKKTGLVFLSGALLGLFGAIFIENTLNGDAYYEAIIPLAIVAGSLGVMSLVMLIRANKLLPFCANVKQLPDNMNNRDPFYDPHYGTTNNRFNILG